MPINVDIISTISLVLDIEQIKAQNNARNIALSNVPNSKFYHVDHSRLMNNISTLRENHSFLEQISSGKINQSYYKTVKEISLDSEIAELSAASGRYQALTDGLSRQFALLQIAIKGNK